MIGIGVGIGLVGLRPTRVLIKDSFNRSDNAAALGLAETGQAWNVSGTWGIRSNKAYSASDASNDLAWVDAGTLSYTASFDGVGQYNSQYRYPSLVLFFVNTSNYFHCRLDSNQAEIIKFESGSSTAVAAASNPVTNGIANNFKAVVANGVINFYVNNVLKVSYDTSVLTAPQKALFLGSTKVGLRLSKSGTPTFNCDYDEFIVQ